jgi:hypothetical protein
MPTGTRLIPTTSSETGGEVAVAQSIGARPRQRDGTRDGGAVAQFGVLGNAADPLLQVDAADETG